MTGLRTRLAGRMMVGASVVALALAAQPAMAQDAAAASDEPQAGDIVVTGIRASLQKSLKTKRDAIGVVDAISAEEMGKFPDTNLAESLQRITGVSIDRNSGEGSKVTVRGIGPDFNLVQLEAVNLGVLCPKCPGGRENTILGALHFGGKWPDNKYASTEIAFPEVLDGFHTYAVEWFADRVVWQVDGRTYAEQSADKWFTTGAKTPAAPFDQPFHLILNLAIGGKLPEGRGLGGVRQDGYPKRMEVDWVRVWQKGAPAARAPGG